MAHGKRLTKIIIFSMLIAASFTAGWLVPAFYDWTGSDQSRPSPLIGQTALGLMVVGIVLGALLPWLPIEHERLDANRTERGRFKIRTLLVITAVVAVSTVALMKIPMVVGVCWCGLALAYTVRFWIVFRPYRWQTAALGACLYLPYIWIFHTGDGSRPLSVILWMMALGLPAFLPTMLIGGLLEQHMQELTWLSMLLTGAELFFGILVIRLGPRLTIAYLLFVLLMSLFGSFGLNALARI